MRKPGGYGVMRDKETGIVLKEEDSYSCRHCGAVRFVKPKQDPTEIGGLCYICSGLICADCVGHGCDELQRRLDREEASYHARRSYGL
jgi:hypothetical protein